MTGQGKLSAFFGLLLMIGISIMIYPGFSQWINDKEQAKVISSYEKETQEYPDEALIEMKEKAIHYNEKLAHGTIVMTDPFKEDAVNVGETEYEEALDTNNAGMMGILTINAIDLKLPVYHGTSDEVLSKAVGHLQGTSLPIGGASTHSVLSAHTGMATARLFTDLPKVVVGDIFILTVLGEDIAYKVYDIDVVLPDDIDSIIIQEGRDLCTLITCTPYGINSHRLLVHGERTDLPDEEIKDLINQGAKINYSLWIFVIVEGLLFILLIVIWRKRKKQKR